MSTANDQTDARPVVRCSHCRLNQYVTESGFCRRCGHKLLVAGKSDPLGTLIGSTVRMLRQAHGLSASAVAARAGVSTSAIYHLERGRKCPTVATIEQVAPALAVPPRVLLFLAFAETR